MLPIAMRTILTVSSLLLLALSAHAQSAGTLRGAVVDDCGRPIGGATLRLAATGRTAVSSASNGRFTLAGLGPGAYDAELAADGRRPQTIRFEIAMGRVTDLGTLTVGAGGSGTCTHRELYRDATTIRSLTLDIPDAWLERSMVSRVEKPCAGTCD